MKRFSFTAGALCFFFLSITAHADFPTDAEEKEYLAALAEADSALEAVAMTSCPGVKLVVSCGNGLCEKSLGEDETSCPADCVSAPVKSYNFQTFCSEIQQVHRPSSVEEVQDAVRSATSAGLRIRVIGRAHTANDQLCTPGAAISTERLRRVIGLEEFQGVETVLVEAGATLHEVAEWLHERERSLGYSVIGFRDVSVAGAAATGSHGSSARHSSVVSSLLESVWVVGPDAELREYSAHNTDASTWKALRANLGMLGAVVRLRLRVQPQFNLRVRVSYHKEQELFGEDGVIAQVRDCDYGIINWFPGTGRFMKSCGTRTDAPAEPGATNVLLDPDVPDFVVKPFKKVLQFGACVGSVSCLVEKVRFLLYRIAPPFKKENKKGKLVSSRDVTGPSHRMMSSALTDHQHGLFQMDWEIAVPYSQAKAAMEAVREHIRKERICLPLVGVFLRFAPAEDATLLAHTTALGEFKAGEPVVFIEMPVYLPTAFPPELQAKYDAPYEDFARLLIEKFKGRPHWAKNREWAFGLQRELDVYGINLDEFRRVAGRLDPPGVFTNRFAAYLGMENIPAFLPAVRSCGLDSARYPDACDRSMPVRK